MKKIVNVILLIMLMVVGETVKACEFDYAKFNDLNVSHSYVVGDYVFNLDNGYSPSLEDFAVAARSIPEGEDVYVYEFLIDGDIYIQDEMFTSKSTEDSDEFPKLDLTYLYWHNIRGAKLDIDYKIFTCPKARVDVHFRSLVTEGDGDYKTSAKRTVEVEADEGAAEARYCITIGTTCEPSTNAELTGQPPHFDVEYPSDSSEQRVCVEVVDKKGNSSGVVCDEVTVKVDKTGATLKEGNAPDSIIEGQPFPTNDLFDIDYGPSGGKTYYYYYEENGDKNILTDLSDLPKGNITVEAVVRSGNGMEQSIDKEITVSRYKITYDISHNGGEKNTEEDSVGWKGKANLKKKATRTGYEFVGWNTDPEAHEGLETYDVNDDTTLYALFKKDLTSEYVISAPKAAVSEFTEDTCSIYNLEEECTVDVPYLSPRISYEALGWSDQRNSTEVTINTDTIDINEDVTYYSVTRKKTPNTATFHTVVDGKPTTETEECYMYNNETNCEITKPKDPDSYKDLEFEGFTKDPKNPSPVDDFTQNKGEEYYAYYKDQYDMTYISGPSNNVKTEHDTAIVYYVAMENDIVKLTEEKTIKESESIQDYNRLGWRTDEESAEATIKAESKMHIEDDITFNAVYEKAISLSYESEDDTKNVPEEQEEKSYYNSASQIQSDAVFHVDDAKDISRTDWIFSTWKDGEEEVPAGSELRLKEDKTLDASWVQDAYVLTFDYQHNGGTSATASTMTYKKSETNNIDLSQFQAQKTGWQFVGWSTEPDAHNEITYQFNLDKNTTLYAIFEKEIYVKFNIQDDTILSSKEDSSVTCKMYNNDTDCEITMPDVEILNEDYGFLGWSSTADTIEGEHQAFDKVKVNSERTYYSITINNKKLVARYYYYDGNTSKVETVECNRYNKSRTCLAAPTIQDKTYNNGKLVGWSTDDKRIVNPRTFEISTDTNFYGVYDRVLSAKFISGDKGSSTVTKTTTMNYIITANNVTSIPGQVLVEMPDGIIGYVTVGWRGDTQSTEAEYMNGNQLSITDDKTYYGIYRKTVELSYYANGGTPTPQSSEKTYYYNSSKKTPIADEGATFTLATPISKVGYSFQGWLENNEASKSYNAGGQITIKVDTKMYANWSHEHYKVTYDFATNGGQSASTTEQNYDYLADVNLDVNATKDGYEFIGWNTNQNAKTKIDKFEMPSHSVTLYAIYRKKVEGTWTVIDEKAGHVENGTTNCYRYNNEPNCYIRTGNFITNDGYNTNGWTTKQNDINPELGNNSYTYMAESTKYYSITRKNDPLVATFYYNDGSIKTTQEKCILYNGQTTCTINPQYRPIVYDGATFIQWSSSQTTLTEPNMTISQNTNYFAYYEKAIGITYFHGLNDKDGKTVKTAIKKYVTGTNKMTIINPTVVLHTQDNIDGYTPLGWRRDQNAAEKQLDNGQNYEISDSIDLYAVYTRTLSLSYDGNGGSTPNTQTTTQWYNSYGNYTSHQFTLAQAATRTGYTFLKWTLDSTTGTEYDAGSQITILKDSVMYAKWQANKYTVTLNPNGGEVTPGQITVQYDANYNFSGNLPTPTKRGYDFQGWFTDSTSGSRVYDGSKMTTPNDHTLYAHWKIQTYNINITVNSNATINKTPIQIEYNGTSQVTITPSSGYLVRSVSCTSGYSATGTFGKTAVGAQTYTIKNNDYVTGGTCTFTIAVMQYTTNAFNCTDGSSKQGNDCIRNYADASACGSTPNSCENPDCACTKHSACKDGACNKCKKTTGTGKWKYSGTWYCAEGTLNAGQSGTVSSGYDYETSNLAYDACRADAWSQDCGGGHGGEEEGCSNTTQDYSTQTLTGTGNCAGASNCLEHEKVEDDSCECIGHASCPSATYCGSTANSCDHTENWKKSYYCEDSGYHITSGQTCEFT